MSNTTNSHSPVSNTVPFKDGVEINKSDFMSEEGLVATRDFKVHEKIFEVKGKLVDYRNMRTLQLDHNIHIDPMKENGEPEFGYYLNHSCDPNTYALVSEDENGKAFGLAIYALKPIKKGQEVYVDYAFMESEIFNGVVCQCNTGKCRGKIIGFKDLPKDEVDRYLNSNIPVSKHLLSLRKNEK